MVAFLIEAVKQRSTRTWPEHGRDVCATPRRVEKVEVSRLKGDAGPELWPSILKMWRRASFEKAKSNQREVMRVCVPSIHECG